MKRALTACVVVSALVATGGTYGSPIFARGS
jgi:hypothetical protein